MGTPQPANLDAHDTGPIPVARRRSTIYDREPASNLGTSECGPGDKTPGGSTRPPARDHKDVGTRCASTIDHDDVGGP
jgi:hypothetical protein